MIRIALTVFALFASVSAGFAATPQVSVSGSSVPAEIVRRADPSGAGALTRFYMARAFRPAWQAPAARAALAGELARLENDGLRPEAYGLAALRAVQDGAPAWSADFDVAATRGMLAALRDLGRGHVNPRRLDPDNPDTPIAGEAQPDVAALSAAVDAGALAARFDAERPAHPAYARLREALAHYRALAAAGPWPELPARRGSLKPGVRDPDVALLRARLVAEGLAEASIARVPDAELYDDALLAVVERFQKQHFLEPDGAVGALTRAALNVPPAERVAQIRANLERARWYLRGLPPAYLMVDLAGFRLSYHRPDGSLWQTGVVIGRPERETPVLRSRVTYLTINPTWTVPPTIFSEDLVPAASKDPEELKRRNIRVLGPDGEEFDPAAIDWSQPEGVTLRQDAGDDNALGKVVFRFPNRHQVYLHDTPHKRLFGRTQRAFSSGCVRVQGASELAALLLADSGQGGAKTFDELVAAGKTRNFPLRQPVPLILAYWTVDVSEPGRVGFKPDVYQRDPALIAALKH
jgi:murein L,D-transpeptidase YcbB/YkuD